MDLADPPSRTSPRPKFVPCAVCGKRVKVKPAGPLPLYCSNAHKQAAFAAKQPKVAKPKVAKVSLEERVAVRVVEMLIERGVITLPPKSEPEQK